MKNLLKDILFSTILVIIILGIMFFVGMIINFVETHPIITIPLIIFILKLLFDEIEK